MSSHDTPAPDTPAPDTPAPDTPAPSPLWARTTWSIVDQAVSSATNFAVALVLARSLGPDEFGQFAIGFAVWLFVDGVARPMLVQPYLVESATRPADDRAVAASHVAGSGTALGALAGAVVVVAAVAGPFDPSAGRTLLVLGVALPALVLQDVLRFVGLSMGRPDRVAANDLVWGIAQGVVLVVLWTTDTLTAATATAAWGGGAAVAAAVGTVQFATMPAFGRSTLRWTSATARVGGWFTVANLLGSTSTLAVTIITARRLGSEGAGALRAVQSLFSPVALISAGTEGIALPEAARAATAGPARFRFAIVVYTVVLVAPAVVVGGLMIVLAEPLVEAVLGEEFAPAAVLVAPLAVAMAAAAGTSAAGLGLRALSEGRALVIAQTPPAIVKAVLCWVLVERHGLEGAGWAIAIGNGVHLLLVWILLLRRLRTPDAGSRPREVVSC